jgi:hypothetical protein
VPSEREKVIEALLNSPRLRVLCAQFPRSIVSYPSLTRVTKPEFLHSYFVALYTSRVMRELVINKKIVV